MTWLVATLAAFGAYRMARMVAEEDGPGFVFKRLRDRFTNDKRSFDLGLRCVYCISFWTALLFTLQLVWMGLLTWIDVPLWWFGIAGVAVKLHEYWNTKR